ncbi:hypothetical protein ACFX13_002878 [Malus domestica]
MDPEANELPKGLVLGRDGNIHIRLTGSTPLDDWDLTIHPLKGPTSSLAHFQPGIGSDTKLSLPNQGSTTSRARLHCSTTLSALSADHALMVLFLGTHASKTS